ncbi:oxidoreductase, short chain dehydrogenase/reductase family protein [Oesophagostomum dentatum]|uniref:Oxidoreductase, short chain dehydrogenase/reductase family protein n=1 Tax=Oesophagostomum dentatum TaxID=61180 RepID=A0A0B1TCE1_OESDE|nr:oxidoreductase, short chain dehydrogenase/reductase family protein [Oesophagostomum dentatum]
MRDSKIVYHTIGQIIVKLHLFKELRLDSFLTLGSSNGIGRATAQLFAREGAMVTLCGRDEATLQESKSLVLAENGGSEEKVLIVSGDIREEEVMERTIDATIEKFGHLDVLVNNAGGVMVLSSTMSIQSNEIDGNMDRFDYAWELNTKSVLRLCQLAFPHLVKTKGDIVNVSSIAGLNNGSGTMASYYGIAKAAQDQLTRTLAIHYITKGVRVNSVSPGPISTNIMQKHGFTDEMVKKMEEKMTAKPTSVPYQRVGTPEDVAKAILFLADKTRSDYIVGHQLVIDGGASLQMPLIANAPEIMLEVFTEAAAKK